MAIFQGDMRSCTLAMDTHVAVILPYDRPAEAQQTPCKVLYLLHGLGDNAAAWCRYTSIERYAREWGIAVVMPEVQRSFYYNMAMGLRYFSYVTQELPQLVAQFFNVSTARSDTYIAGLSMGGYGALKCGLTYPGQYAGCASFSGVVDMNYVLDEHLNTTNTPESMAVFGEKLQLADNDNLFYLAKQCSALPRQEHPEIFITCGQQDFLYDINTQFKQYLDTIPLDFRYMEWEGIHEWGFWDKSIRLALDYFLSK